MIQRRAAVDMINGPLIKNILLFSFPIMLSGILQMLYNAADIIVVGQFAQAGSIGAIGATNSIINLIINTFIGMSVGTCVLVAQYAGAGDIKGIDRAVHTSVLIALIAGVIVAATGFLSSGYILHLVGTPSDIIDRSTLYMQIFFLGSPFNLLYNFGSAILRAVGDTKRPLYYLSAAGIANILLNLLFVTVFHLGVAGVAIGTVASQMISSILVILCLMKSYGPAHLDLKKLKIHKKELIFIAKIGIPGGIQSALFSLSNVLIQSSVNSFGSAVVEGNAAGSSIDGFIYISMNSVSQATITFFGQNYGAKKYGRMNRIIGASCTVVILVAAALGALIFLLKGPLASVYLSNPAQATADTLNLRLSVFCSMYFCCGIMEITAGAMRGMNYSFLPMTVSLIGVCAFRIVWIYTVFAVSHSMLILYISYPVSWAMTAAAHGICYITAKRKLRNTQPDCIKTV